MPLILGFFLIALLFVGAAVMASDAFTRQRDLQSICDGAAVAATNSVDFGAVRTELDSRSALPLAGLADAVEGYLGADAGRNGVTASVNTQPGGEVTVSCSRRSVLAFAGMFGNGVGIVQRTSSTATAPLQ